MKGNVSYYTALFLIAITGMVFFPVMAEENMSAMASPEPTQDMVGKKELYISQGTFVAAGEYEAVGRVSTGCSGTLINRTQVLTAGHCFKGNPRVSFTLPDVFPVDNPATVADESKTRTDVTITGTIWVHPEYSYPVWSRDYAIIELDTPVDQLAKVTPMTVELPAKSVLVGDTITSIGYGDTGTNCNSPSLDKRRAVVTVKGSGWGGFSIKDPVIYLCPGDSGGPALNPDNKIVGVAAWSWRGPEGSTWRPTAYAYNWIMGIPEPGWSSCSWVGVGQKGINSHAAGNAWCPEGSYITAMDLDANLALDAHDSPVIGQVRCCKLAGAENAGWSTCSWNKVANGGSASHNSVPVWCPDGSFIVALDLDSKYDLVAGDSPVVGQAMCCGINDPRYVRWGSSGWKGVETENVNSHSNENWCWDGSFVTQIDLDSQGNPADSPVVGWAKCSRARPVQSASGPGIITAGTGIGIVFFLKRRL